MDNRIVIRQVSVIIKKEYKGYAGVDYFRKRNGMRNTGTLKSDISFAGDALKIARDKNIFEYNNIKGLASSIDKVLGKSGGDFLSKIEKAGISTSENRVTIYSEKFADELLSTLAYPIFDLPCQIMEGVGKLLKKTNLSKLNVIGNKILTNEVIKARLQKLDAKKSYAFVSKVLEQFCEAEKYYPGNLKKLTESFAKVSASKVANSAKAYASRDERTLNRLVTGGIGALFSAIDMYNISMLEKNDKKDAKKAENDRRQQEMARVGLSAGLTFLSLGVFDKFTKGNYILSACIIAGSTLVSEIVSRLIKHKPLIPLTPEGAKRIAHRNKINKKDSSKNIPASSSVQIAMGRIKKSDRADLYKDFTMNKTDEVRSRQTVRSEQPAKKTKRSKDMILYIGAAFATCSLLYLVIRYAKGEYKNKVQIKKFVEAYADKLEKYLNSSDLSRLTEEQVETIDTLSKKTTGKLEALKDLITKHDVTIDMEFAERELEELSTSTAAKDIRAVLEVYKKQIAYIKNNEGMKNYSQSMKNTLPNALYEGFTKIFKTLYTILSAPARLACYLMERKFESSEKTFKDVVGLYNTQNKERILKQYKKEIAELYQILQKYKHYGDEKCDYVAKTINTHTHNFEKGAETGELANFSRTLVTLIASYFYVNDFRNAVLIESEGKNTQRAQEVMNDSISFKLFNFFFNGTLMNLFNSVFKGTLNGSLLGATAVAAATEFTNEFAIRKTISRPMRKLKSREAIIEFEQTQANRKGFAGWWTRNFKKLTGQKSLTEKYESQNMKKK